MPIGGFDFWNTGIPSWSAYDMYNTSDFSLLCPNNMSIWNPMFSMPVDIGFPNQSFIAQGGMQAADFGRNQAQIDLAKIAYKMAGNELNYVKGNTEALLKDKNLTDAQKAVIEQVLEAVKEGQKRLNEIKTGIQNGSIDPSEGREEIYIIGEATKELKEQAAEIAKAIAESIEADKTDKKGTTTETEEEVTETPNKTETEHSDNENTAVTAEQKARIQTDSKNIANQIFLAVDGIGTDTKAVKENIGKIDENNVLEVLNHWNNKLAPQYDGESMLETLYNEAALMSSRKELTNTIVDALAKRAEKEGINVDDEVFAIKRELNSFFGFNSNEKVWEGVNNIQRAINNQLAAKASANAKAEVEAKKKAEKEALDMKSDSTKVAPAATDSIAVQRTDSTLVQRADSIQVQRKDSIPA